MPGQPRKRQRKSISRGTRSFPDIPASKTQQERTRDFVKEYKKTGDIVEACGLSGLSNGNAKMLIECHPELRADMTALLASCGVTPTLIVTQLRRLATSDIRKTHDKDGNPLSLHELDDDTAMAITKIRSYERSIEKKDGTEEKETTTEIALADREGPTRELAKMAGLASDRLEIANPRGEKFNINNEGPTETRDQIIASLLALVIPKKDPPPAAKSSKTKEK